MQCPAAARRILYLHSDTPGLDGQLQTRAHWADGFACVREPRQSLMRRAVTAIDGELQDIRLRNISVRGALVECTAPVTPGDSLTIDIVGVGPVVGTVRWAQRNRFGIQFSEDFDLRRLAPRKEKRVENPMLQPWYVTQAEKAVG